MILLLKILYFVIVVTFIVYSVYCAYRHRQMKEYFWNVLPNDEKELVNYIGHRSVLFIDDIPWAKREKKFQEKRNQALLNTNYDAGQKLIRLERTLCKCDWLSVLLFFIALILFHNT